MRHREHSDEAIILGSGASTNEAIRDIIGLTVAHGGSDRTGGGLFQRVPDPAK